ncbi:MAG: carbon-monoxide dehydrogenase medium subunit [Planctomycetota bacterium]|nr:MAG: carbon-monoxide dehydrogenase medium subunit [Planctomycetota bacterium]
MTDWIRPANLAEALSARAAHGDYMLLAGGTDLMVGASERAAPAGVIDLFGLDELCALGRDDDGRLRLGAGLTYERLLADPLVRAELPALHDASREVGALQIQARGTLGGNLGTCSPVGDTLPVLLALDAEIELRGPSGTRRLPVDAFCLGYRETALADDELIVAVRFPADIGRRSQVWRKVGTRRAQSISKVMLAASTARADDGALRNVRVGLGAIAAQPLRARETEAVLEGRVPDDALADIAAQTVQTDIAPIDDVRSRADYRRAITGRLVRRWVLQLADAQR